MLNTKKLSLALAAFALVAASCDAQQWNRRVSDVRIVHPPGTPPGTWRVTAECDLAVFAPPPAPLTFDCELSVNGAPISVVTVPAEPSAQVNNCPTACNPTPCLYLLLNSIPTTGVCGPAGIGCACYNTISVDLGPFHSGSSSDMVTVHVGPTVGSLPENDTSDDTLSRIVGENNPGTVTCTGGGVPTLCPCGNSGLNGHGCANASNPNGAELVASGFVEALPGGTDSVALDVTGMPSGAPLLWFQGTSGASVLPFGDGVLCVTGSLIRLRVKINVGGAARFPVAGEPSLSSTGGVTPGSGATMHYQAYYRDSATYCTSATFNLTNGISLTWY